MQVTNYFRYLLLYIPFVLSWLLIKQEHASYLIAWFGSFYIFFLTYKGLIKPLPKDLPISEQLLRPIFLMHIIFAGYMATSSIFYYLNALGYEYSAYMGKKSYLATDIFSSIAKCQCYYVLGHAALIHGIISGMKYPIESKYTLYIPSMSNLLLAISVICLPVAYVFGHLGPLSQFSVQLNGLSFVAGTIALAFAIREHKKTNTWIGIALFVINFLQTLVSGFKEPIIISVLLLGVFLLPIYGKKIVPLFIVILVGLFFVLPTFIGNYRKVTAEGTSAEEARNQSIGIVTNKNSLDALKDNNWEFLTMRLSEMDMFIKYIGSTPSYVPYYKTKLTRQALYSLIPRFFWKGKPDMELQVMERVYNAGVIDPNMLVSAKPAFIVDCYLSYGIFGIFIGLFLYGRIAQFISSKAESLFGGYFMGSAVMFTGLFQIFWRGNCFEFIFNSIFWSFITMLIIFSIFKAKNILTQFS